MKKITLIVIIVSFVMVLFFNCDITESFDTKNSQYITGLTTDNYPNMDGSTSTAPLNTLIACKLFDFNYQWVYTSNIKEIVPNVKSNYRLWDRIKSSQTHNSFINLVDKKADLILSARTMSLDEKAYAESKGISLIETPIALDAFVMIVNPDNPIESLTAQEIQDIYTRKITHWNEVGVNEFPYWTNERDNINIRAYIRNPNSGSQELMELFVMNGLDTSELFLTDFINNYEVIFSMAGAMDAVAQEITSICYTVYYYMEYQSSGKDTVKPIAVNEIYPNRETIGDSSYPYTAPVYAVIRSDLDEASMAYKIYEWLQTEAGKRAIDASGYVLY